MGREPKQYGCCGSLVIVGLIGFIALVFNGILNRRDRDARSSASPPPAVAPPAARPPESRDTLGGSVRLTSEDFGGHWPIDANEILLVCEPTTGPLSGRPAHHVVAVVAGRTYAVNGTAAGAAPSRGWRDLGEMLPRDPDGTFTIEAIRFRQALVERGLALCR